MLYSIIGWRCLVGAWCRVEGTMTEPNPNYAHAMLSNESLFHDNGTLIASVTVLGEWSAREYLKHSGLVVNTKVEQLF